MAAAAAALAMTRKYLEQLNFALTPPSGVELRGERAYAKESIPVGTKYGPFLGKWSLKPVNESFAWEVSILYILSIRHSLKEVRTNVYKVIIKRLSAEKEIITSSSSSSSNNSRPVIIEICSMLQYHITQLEIRFLRSRRGDCQRRLTTMRGNSTHMHVYIHMCVCVCE